MEFYVKFWPILGTDLVNVLNSCYFSGVMSLTQRRCLISLIFKKGDCLDPRNWRPITLLNVDYKLAARVVAGRLLKVIHLIVAKDQTCGVPGRFIGENVSIFSRRTTGILEFVPLKTLLSWRQRNLSFRVKALVINGLFLSRIWYVIACPHASVGFENA